MALVNPDTRRGLNGMITGSVDRHWASHHYGRWYREHFSDPVASERTDLETASHADAVTGAATPGVLSVPPPAKRHAPSADTAEPSASAG